MRLLSRQHFLIYGLGILFLFWSGFVLSRYFYVLTNLPWLTLNLGSSGGLVNKEISKLISLAVLIIFFNIVGIIVSRISKQPISKILIAGLLIATVLLLSISADRLLWFKTVLFFGVMILTGFGAVFLYRIIFKSSIPYWAGLLLSIIIIHFWLFVTGLSGMFRPAIVLPFIIFLAGIGCIELWKNSRTITNRAIAFVDNLNWPSLLFIEGLWLVLAAGFIAACTTETYSDAMRNHVPFMINLVRDGVLAPNYYWYSHLQASPLQLLSAGGYLFLGELGAKWFTWLMGITIIAIIIAEVYDITRKQATALGTGFIFISMPYIWLWLTTNYQDLPTATLLLAGLATFRRTFTGQDGYLPISGLFLGFAVISKFFAIVLIIPMAIIFSLFYSKPILSSIKQKPMLLVYAIAGFFLTAIPWLILVWYWTDNPFFPFLNSIFKSPYIVPNFVENIAAGQQKLFKFPYGWMDVLLWPWSMTFQTNNFGELPAGGTGPFFLIFYPVILIYVVWYALYRGKGTLGKVSVAIFLVGMAYLAGLTYMIKIPYMRYWSTGLAVIAIPMGITFSEMLATVNSKNRNWISVGFVATLVSISLAILFAWGVRLNYGSPDGIGWSLYTGKISKDEYLKTRTGNVYLYVNKHIKPGESIMAVGYEQLNTFNNFTFQLNIWYDKNMGLHTLRDYENLVSKANVRYWVVKDSFKTGYYADIGVAQKYWQEGMLVCSQDGFSVYSTRLSAEPKSIAEIKLSSTVITATTKGDWRIAGNILGLSRVKAQGQFDSQIYSEFLPPAEAKRLSGSIYFIPDQDGAVILTDIIWRHGNREISRSVSSTKKAIKGQLSILNFGVMRPADADRVLIIVRPWRREDGMITIEGAKIHWWQ
ncbi:MAG: hypothetical protein FJ242_01610 [Nitrospira sp.]|nr:hypothetical protein [Nitrospira sp.]